MTLDLQNYFIMLLQENYFHLEQPVSSTHCAEGFVYLYSD
jgi:hypothetical protein